MFYVKFKCERTKLRMKSSFLVVPAPKILPKTCHNLLAKLYLFLPETWKLSSNVEIRFFFCVCLVRNFIPLSPELLLFMLCESFLFAKQEIHFKTIFLVYSLFLLSHPKAINVLFGWSCKMFVYFSFSRI